MTTSKSKKPSARNATKKSIDNAKPLKEQKKGISPWQLQKDMRNCPRINVSIGGVKFEVKKNHAEMAAKERMGWDYEVTSLNGTDIIEITITGNV